VKIANTKYTSIKNDYCIVFDRDSNIVHQPDDDKIKAQGFSFVTIDEINEFEQQRTVDVVGVITQVSTVSSFQPKPFPDGTPKPAKDRRNLTITDESGLEISVTLWGGNATKQPYEEGRILQIKGAKVSDY
jgi:replication factor A1